MSPLRRGPDKTRRDVEAVLDISYPGASAETRLHALIFAIYRGAVFEHRGGRADVVQRAGARGVTCAKLDQILSGDLAGIKWAALEAVLAACDAVAADIDAAQALFDRAQTSPGPMIPEPGATPWAAGSPLRARPADVADDWVPARDRPRTAPADPPTWAWPTNKPDDPGCPPGAEHDVPAEQAAAQNVVFSSGTVSEVEDIAAETTAQPARRHADPDLPATGNDTAQAPADAKEATAPAPTQRPPGNQKIPAPDPHTATTIAGFVQLMKTYRAFYGDPPYRAMAKACEDHPKVKRAYSYASFSTIGKNGKLPKRDLVRAYIAGCGGSNTDIERWTQAHQRLSVQHTAPVGSGPAEE